MKIIGFVERIGRQLKLKHVQQANTAGKELVDGERSGKKTKVPYSWLLFHCFEVLKGFPMGVSEAVYLTELQNRLDRTQSVYLEGIAKHSKRINAVLERSELDLGDILEVKVIRVYKLPETNTYMLELRDCGSSGKITMYLHKKFYHLAEDKNGILNPAKFNGMEEAADREKGVTIRLTNCRLTESFGRIKLLPTEDMVLLLESQHFAMIEKMTTQVVKLKQLFMSEVKSREQFSKEVFVVKVINFGDLSVDKNGATTIHVYVNDGSCTCHVSLVLTNDQTNLANLFLKDDLLYIIYPLVEFDCNTETLVLKCGSYTVICCTSSKVCEDGAFGDSRTSLSQLSQISRHAIGKVTDCSTFPERVKISDLRGDYVNICLIGCILSMSRIQKSNAPLVLGSNSEIVLSMKLYDESGVCTITFRNGEIEHVKKFKEGQAIAFSGLKVTSAEEQGAMELCVYDSNVFRAFNLSAIAGHLGSPFLRSLTSLQNASSKAVFGTKATITGYRVCKPFQLIPLHSSCGHDLSPLDGAGSEGSMLDSSTYHGDYWCSFCGATCRSNTTYTFRLKGFYVIIDDGIQSIIVCVANDFLAEAAGVDVAAFGSMDYTSCNRTLDSLIGEQFFFLLSNCQCYNTDSNNSKSCDDHIKEHQFRIDSLCSVCAKVEALEYVKLFGSSSSPYPAQKSAHCGQ
eukprot:Nk52_evm25s1020 gene=Nk52_evmTU25s1020